MDEQEFERLLETGERPGVRVVGLVLLTGILAVCSFLSYASFTLLN